MPISSRAEVSSGRQCGAVMHAAKGPLGAAPSAGGRVWMQSKCWREGVDLNVEGVEARLGVEGRKEGEEVEVVRGREARSGGKERMWRWRGGERR